MTLNNFLEAVAENLSACGPIDTYSSMKSRRILTGISSSELSKRHRKRNWIGAAGVMSRLKFFISWRRRITLTSTNGPKNAGRIRIPDCGRNRKPFPTGSPDECHGQKGRRQPRLSVSFDADFYFVITPEVIPTMYYLDQDNTIRSEVIE